MKKIVQITMLTILASQLTVSDTRISFLNRSFAAEASAQGKAGLPTYDHSLRTVINPGNFALIDTQPVAGIEASYVNKDLMVLLGLADPSQSESALKAAVTEKFSWEVVRPGKQAPVPSHGPQVMALAYNDGYLGIGDGRATWLFEKTVPGIGVFDVGNKGAGITKYGIPQASIDAGFHVAEKDGYLSLQEAVKVTLDSIMLGSVGIESERILAILETEKQTGFNLKPPAPTPAAIVVRAFNTGLRGAHFKVYSPEEMKAVTQWLKEREAVRLGTDAIPSTQEYAMNKIKRDAQRAARAQHFWVLHGAINTANIFENGWADLAYVEAMSVPDGRHTSLNVYSRLETQNEEFQFVTERFIDAVVKTEPGLVIDAAFEFQKQYAAELGKLELISIGLSPEAAEKMATERPALVAKFVKYVWNINYNNLKTNTRQLKAGLLQAAIEWSLSGKNFETDKAIADAQRDGSYVPEEVLTHEMFPEDRAAYLAKQASEPQIDRNIAVPKLQANQLAAVMVDIIEKSNLKPFKQIDAATKATLLENARKVSAISLPTFMEHETAFAQYQKSGQKGLNQFLASKIQSLKGVQAAVSTSYSLNLDPKIENTSKGTFLERGRNALEEMKRQLKSLPDFRRKPGNK